MATAVRSMSTATAGRSYVTERTYSCSDGVKLAARCWTNFDVDDHPPPSSSPTRKIICLHGWLDNAASFDRLAPLLLDTLSYSDAAAASASTPDNASSAAGDGVPTEIVALDFPGHGLSGHKSVDGPPQLLAEYAYYVAELVEALQWGGKGANSNDGVSRSVVANINQNVKANGKDDEEVKPPATKSDGFIVPDDEDPGTDKKDKVVLIGHSMGSGVATVLCAAFPEWFSALVCLEGGLVARNARDAARHVRAACQRRMKSNKTLFPDASYPKDETVLPRSKVYSNVDAAVQARLTTAGRMPGDQYLSYEAARDMVARATAPARVGRSSADDESVVFRHDPRLQWPSLQYFTREQVEAFHRSVNESKVPVCFLSAEDGWPEDAWTKSVVEDVLRPRRLKKLSGSHHFHADPDSFVGVAEEIVVFARELKL